jgi:hypothetical protein
MVRRVIVSKDETHAWYRGNREAFEKDFEEAYQVTLAEVKAYYEKKKNQGPFHILSAYIAMTVISELLYGRAKRYFDTGVMNVVDRKARIDWFDEAIRRACRKSLASRKEHFGVKQT